MTRAEFVDNWINRVAAGRRLNFPDITPAEEACTAIDDEHRAGQVWRRWREVLVQMPLESYDLAMAFSAKAAKVSKPTPADKNKIAILAVSRFADLTTCSKRAAV